MATTAGRSEASTPCSVSSSRQRRYSRESSVRSKHDGRMQPSVAVSAPGTPASLVPTNVAALIAIGPGVISAMATRSANSCGLSQPRCFDHRTTGSGTVNAGFGLRLRCAKNVPCHAYGRGRRGMPGYSRIFASSSIVSSNTRSALRTVSGLVRSTPAILSSSSG